MAARKRLDRNARVAVTTAVVVLLAGPLLFLRSCVSQLATDEPIVASSHHDDRLVFVAGHTMVLQHGSLQDQIANWLKIGTADTRAFEIGDQTFAPNSAVLTPGGWSHLTYFVQIMKGHPALTAHILVSPHIANAAVGKLEELRARRLRDGIVELGIRPSRVTASDQSAAAVPSAQSHQPTDGNSRLVVLLSK